MCFVTQGFEDLIEMQREQEKLEELQQLTALPAELAHFALDNVRASAMA